MRTLDGLDRVMESYLLQAMNMVEMRKSPEDIARVLIPFLVTQAVNDGNQVRLFIECLASLGAVSASRSVELALQRNGVCV